MRKKGFNIINLTTLEQLCYASNFLCIKDGQILAIEVEREVKSVLKNLESKAAENPHRYTKLLEQAKKDYNDLRTSGGIFPHKKEYPAQYRRLRNGDDKPYRRLWRSSLHDRCSGKELVW